MDRNNPRSLRSLSSLSLLALPLLGALGLLGCDVDDEVYGEGPLAEELELRAASPSLAGHWSFDGCAGQSTDDDLSGHNRTLTLGSGASCSTQGSSSTFFAGGSAATSTIANSSGLNFQYEMTATMWIRPTTTSGSRKLIDRGTPFHITLENGKIIFHVKLDNGAFYHINSNTTIPVDEWTQVTAVVVPWTQNRQMRLYVNGKNVSNTTIPYVKLDQSSNAWRLARRVNNYGYYGHIDDVRLYDRALSQAEISAAYNAGHQAPPYANFGLQTDTPLTVSNTLEMLVATNRDVFGIRRDNTGTKRTEVHVLSAASNYQSFSLQTGTALGEVGDSFDFVLGDNRDLFAIARRSTGSNSMEVHVMSAASNYQSFSMQTGTAMHELADTSHVAIAPNRDLFVVHSANTGSGKTEVHVLSAASNYQSFALNTATALPSLGGEIEFEVADNRDLYLIAKSPTGSGTTEVHALSAASNYQSFVTQTPTVKAETGTNYAFGLADDDDLFALQRSGAAKTRVEVIPASL